MRIRVLDQRPTEIPGEMSGRWTFSKFWDHGFKEQRIKLLFDSSLVEMLTISIVSFIACRRDAPVEYCQFAPSGRFDPYQPGGS
jgi:hypothetical protein